MMSAAYAIDRNPSTYASAVPSRPSFPMRPAATPMAKKSADIWSKSHSHRSTPTTNTVKLPTTSRRMVHIRQPLAPAAASCPVAATAAVRCRAAYRMVYQV